MPVGSRCRVESNGNASEPVCATSAAVPLICEPPTDTSPYGTCVKRTGYKCRMYENTGNNVGGYTKSPYRACTAEELTQKASGRIMSNWIGYSIVLLGAAGMGRYATKR